MTLTTEDAHKRFLASIDAQADATNHTMHLALLSLAMRAREEHPAAAYIGVEPSDQGDWMHIEALYDAEGHELEVDFEDEGEVTSLYDSYRATWEAFCMPLPPESNGAHRMINVQAVLDAEDTIVQAPKPRIEILHTRDPDSSCDHTVWVDGVETTDYALDSLDPGAGYEDDDWLINKEEAEASTTMSPAFKAAVVQAYDDMKPTQERWASN